MREASPASSEPAASSPLREPVASAAYQAASRLMESLLHDARNPLNALAINLEVLGEKLKDDDGKIPETQDKNLRAMREQVFRVDGILRQFAEFMTPRLGARGEQGLSELVQGAVEVVAHESRRRRVKLKVTLEPGLTGACPDAGLLHLLLVQALLRAISRTDSGGETSVVLAREGGQAVLTLSDPAPDSHEPLPQALEAISSLCADLGVPLATSGGTLQLTFGVRA